MASHAKPRHTGGRRGSRRKRPARKARRALGALLTAVIVGVLSTNSGAMARGLWHRVSAAVNGPAPGSVAQSTLANTVPATLDPSAGPMDAAGTVAVAGGLSLTAVHVARDVCEGAPGWRVPVAPGHLGPAPDPNKVLQWAMRHGGEEVSGTQIDLTLQNHARPPVTLTGIAVKLDGRQSPRPGLYVTPWGQCGGGGTKAHYLVAKLDDIPPQVYAGRMNYSPHATELVRQASGRPFDTHTYRLVRGKPMEFKVFAYTNHYDCTWRLQITWLTGAGRRHVTTVTDAGGEPFRTVPRPSSTSYTSESGLGTTATTPFWSHH